MAAAVAATPPVSTAGWRTSATTTASPTATGSGEVTVAVGAQGNGGAFAFDPPAIRVSTGTTVVWEWTGEGAQHNVAAAGGGFESDMSSEEGYTFEHTFAEAVFEALWVEGDDIGDPEVLADCAEAAGLDPSVVDAALDDEVLHARLDDLFDAARREGVTGVPTFAYDGHAARGAVPPAQLRRLIEGV